MRKNIGFICNKNGKSTYKLLPVTLNLLSFDALSLAENITEPFNLLDGELPTECLERKAKELKNSYKLASKVRYYRLQNGLTLDELSCISGVSKTQLHSIETHKINLANVTLQNSIKIANALGVTPDQLL